MSDLRIPPALDRHLVSAVRMAATTGDPALGAFVAVVEQVAHALREQGASGAAITRALADVFTGLAFPYQRTPIAARYATLEKHAISIATRIAGATVE
jgi:hypothetical protein